MEPHEDDVAHVARSERIPRVEDVVVAERDVVAVREQLLDARHAAAARVRVEAALKVCVDERVADEIDVAHAQQAEELAAVGVVVAVHRGRVARRHHILHAAFKGARGEDFKPLRLLVVDLVAVDVHKFAVLLRYLHAVVDGLDGIFAREFKVRYRADAVGSHFDGIFEELLSVRIAHDALLRESNYLNVDEVLEFLAQLYHSLHRYERRVGYVYVRADVLDAV